MKRRNFIHTASSAIAVSLLDWHSAFADHKSEAVQPALKITELQLFTATSLSTLKSFYKEVLELSVVHETTDRLTIGAGETQITFIKIAAGQENPFYHVAFNIPENKIRQARDWQLKRTALIPTPSHMIDPAFPGDIRHFRNWNAHSVFFLDTAGNLLEYIARHGLKNATSNNFSGKDILYASEIAFIVNDVEATAKEFKETLGLPQYLQGSADFTAIGDEHGLLLLMKKGRIWNGNTGKPLQPGMYNTKAVIKTTGNKRWNSKVYPYEILAT